VLVPKNLKRRRSQNLSTPHIESSSTHVVQTRAEKEEEDIFGNEEEDEGDSEDLHSMDTPMKEGHEKKGSIDVN